MHGQLSLRALVLGSAALIGAGLLSSGDALAKKKKKGGDEPPPVGWVQPEGAAHACYYPPAWGVLNTTERKMARGVALDEMKGQWLGKRDDGVSFSEDTVDMVETTLLGRPEKIEDFAGLNLQQCLKSAGGGGPAAWGSWLKAMPERLTVGECMQPLDYTMFDYLDIGTGWQRPLRVCEGDKIRIAGTAKDRYRITEGGEFINVDGDTSQPAVGSDYPCNIEGCFAGQLIMRFVSDAGVESILPVGSERIWIAPEHGEITYRINDTVYFDNAWFRQGSMDDHTAIEISPVE